jgi:hypothetical protein
MAAKRKPQKENALNPSRGRGPRGVTLRCMLYAVQQHAGTVRQVALKGGAWCRNR